MVTAFFGWGMLRYERAGRKRARGVPGIKQNGMSKRKKISDWESDLAYSAFQRFFMGFGELAHAWPW